jgi:hypothetical protein
MDQVVVALFATTLSRHDNGFSFFPLVMVRAGAGVAALRFLRWLACIHAGKFVCALVSIA